MRECIDIRPQVDEIMARVNFDNAEYLNSLFQKLQLYFYEAYEHSSQVAMWSSIIAYHCKMTKEDVNRVNLAALLHDIGKLHIPQEILEKDGALTEEEYAQIKHHPMEGFHLIKDYVPACVSFAVLMHHERIDGSGYPFQMKTEQIPEYAKIIMLADAFSAMTVDRVYRPAMTWEEALAELHKEAYRYDEKYLQALEYVVGNNEKISLESLK